MSEPITCATSWASEQGGQSAFRQFAALAAQSGPQYNLKNLKKVFAGLT